VYSNLLSFAKVWLEKGELSPWIGVWWIHALALAMYGIGEYVAPPLAQFAHTEKTTSRLAGVSFAGRASAWIKEGNLILRLRTAEVGQVFGGATLF
jgi:hypothetical protein